jgi:hypothetical protein
VAVAVAVALVAGTLFSGSGTVFSGGGAGSSTVTVRAGGTGGASPSRLPPMSPTRLIPRITPTTTPTPSAIRSVFTLIFFPSESQKTWLCPSRRLSNATTVAGMAGCYLDVLQAGVANFYEKALFVKGDVATAPRLTQVLCPSRAMLLSALSGSSHTLWWLGA